MNKTTIADAGIELARMVLAREDSAKGDVIARDSVAWQNMVAQAGAMLSEHQERVRMIGAVNDDMAREFIRDVTAHLREARDERVREHKLAMLDGGIALELIDRGEALMRSKEFGGVPELFQNILEQLALRHIMTAKYEPVPDRIVIPLSVESLQPKNCLEWVFGNQNNYWEASLMLDSEVLVNITSRVVDGEKDEVRIAIFIADVIQKHEAKVA